MGIGTNYSSSDLQLTNKRGYPNEFAISRKYESSRGGSHGFRSAAFDRNAHDARFSCPLNVINPLALSYGGTSGLDIALSESELLDVFAIGIAAPQIE